MGTRLTDFTTGSKELFRNPDVDFVLINVSRYHAKKLDALPLVVDAKVGILAITAGLEKANYRSAYTSQIQKAKSTWDKEMEILTGNTYGEDYNSLI